MERGGASELTGVELLSERGERVEWSVRVDWSGVSELTGPSGVSELTGVECPS